MYNAVFHIEHFFNFFGAFFFTFLAYFFAFSPIFEILELHFSKMTFASYFHVL